MTSKEKIEHRKYLRETKEKLYKKYCKLDNSFKDANKDRIDYVIDEVLSKQMLLENPAELEAIHILSNKGIRADYQKLIPILSEGGKLEHLYVADIVVGKTVIEIDGNYHKDEELLARDFYREENIKKAGYKVKRYFTTELNKLKEEKF